MSRDPLSTLLEILRMEVLDLSRDVKRALALCCVELRANAGGVLFHDTPDGALKLFVQVGSSQLAPLKGLGQFHLRQLALALRDPTPFVVHAHDLAFGPAKEPRHQLTICAFKTSNVAGGAVLLRTRSRDLLADEKQLIEAFAHWLGLILAISSTNAEPLGEAMNEAHSVRQLSARERQVASHVARGLTNEEIAAELTITSGTVSNHIEHILRKLEANRRTQIASWAAQHGLA